MQPPNDTPSADVTSPARGGRVWRVTRAALVVAALGGVGGALTGALLSLLFFSLLGGFAGVRDFAGAIVLGGALGGAFGLLLGPAAGFGLLRRVPLGVAILGTAAGTLLGFFGGLTLQRAGLFPASPLFAALAGFGVAAVLLRWRYRPRARPHDDARHSEE